MKWLVKSQAYPCLSAFRLAGSGRVDGAWMIEKEQEGERYDEISKTLPFDVLASVEQLLFQVMSPIKRTSRMKCYIVLA